MSQQTVVGLFRPTTEQTEIKVHPVQRSNMLLREPHVAPQVVTLRAYEVYCEVFGPQGMLVTGDYRNGFSIRELVAFLYARSFPKTEWDARFHEALKGLSL